MSKRPTCLCGKREYPSLKSASMACAELVRVGKSGPSIRPYRCMAGWHVGHGPGDGWDSVLGAEGLLAIRARKLGIARP